LSIIGVGTDIVEIVRIREAVEKWGDQFLNKVFSNNEVTYCYSRNDPALHLAARFAAKESCIKALSATTCFHLSMRDIEVSNDSSGKPSILIGNEEFLSTKIMLYLSLSHERNYAVATVIAEQ
jgi:holo-[acyl-carrier protein] synthase